MAHEGDIFFSIARNYVEMDVHHGLSGRFAVVLQNVEAVAEKGGLEVRSNLLYPRDEGCERFVRRIDKPRRVFFRDHQGVSLRKRVDVEICEDEIVFVNLEGRDFAGGDGTEYAIVFHVADYTTACCMEGCIFCGTHRARLWTGWD